MTRAVSILSGAFGRVALLDMDTCLVDHAHPHCHLIMKASGPDQMFWVEGQAWPIRDDTAVAVNAWQEHEYVHRPSAERTVFLALYLEPAWLANADHTFTGCVRPRFFSQSCSILSPQMAGARNALAETMAGRVTIDRNVAETLIFDLTVGIVQAQGPSERGALADSGRVSDYRIRRAIRLMRESNGMALDLDAVAAGSGLSRPHFNVLFRKGTGVSPNVFANALRVEAVVGVLRSSNRGVGDVAADLRFSAQGNLTRFFQQHTGAAPAQFRRALAELA